MSKISNIFSYFKINDFINLLDIQIAIAIIIITKLLSPVIARAIIKIENKIKKRDLPPNHSILFEPVKTIIFLIGFYGAFNFLDLPKKFDNILNTLMHIFMIILICRSVIKSINMKAELARNKNDKSIFTDFFIKVLDGIVYLIAGFLILKELDYDLSGLAAGLGIGSAVIALAAQDVVKSLLGGLTIITDKPFEIGDWIEIGQYSGSVLDITFRSTRIQTANNSIVNIPNSLITNEYLVNWNRLDKRRYDIKLAFTLETTNEQLLNLKKKLKTVIENHPNVIADTVQIFFESISANSNDLHIFLYINKVNYIDFLKIKEELNCEILKIIDNEKIDLAYNTQTIYIKNNNKETD